MILCTVAVVFGSQAGVCLQGFKQLQEALLSQLKAFAQTVWKAFH